MKLLFYKRMLF